MRKLLPLAMLLCLILVFTAACGGADTPAPAPAPAPAPDAPAPAPAPDAPAPAPTDEVRHIILHGHNAVVEGNSYRIRYEQDIKDASDDAIRFGFDVRYVPFVSDWDATVEAQNIRQSIDEGVDIIIVNPVSPTGMDPLIEMAQAQGIIWINADCIYDSPHVDILNIATDQEYLGYRTATEAGRVLGNGAKVVMIQAMEGNVANTDRQRGFERGIEEFNFEVVHGGAHNWNSDLSQQIMTEIINSGVEFDGVLISQAAHAALTAFDNTGAPWPKFMGFHDNGEWMQRMFEINADERVMDFLVLSNPPGVGATALNFGLNILLGRELRDDIFDDPALNSVLIFPRIWFNYDNMEEYRDLAFSTAPGDAISFWLDVDEVAEQFFR